MEDDRLVVVHPDSMELETFCLHMTHRHGESLGGLPELRIKREGDVSQAYRAFHRSLHRLRDTDMEHVHGEFVPAIEESA